jgi:hypothetical protein
MKLPVAFESSAIKEPVNVPPEVVNGTTKSNDELEQKGLPETEPVTIARQVLIERSLPLSGLTVAGAVFLTLILYPLPVVVDERIIAAIGEFDPDPMVTGLLKLPAASDNSAIKVPVKLPVVVNGTETAYEVPEQKGLPETDPIVMETGQF